MRTVESATCAAHLPSADRVAPFSHSGLGGCGVTQAHRPPTYRDRNPVPRAALSGMRAAVISAQPPRGVLLAEVRSPTLSGAWQRQPEGDGVSAHAGKHAFDSLALDGPGEIEALCEVRPDLDGSRPMRQGLDALDHDSKVQGVSEMRHGRRYRAAFSRSGRV